MSARPWWEPLKVAGCGNPEHGPDSPCWDVLDVDGAVVLRGVDKATAERYAAGADMARALLGIIACAHADGETICARCLKDARAALAKAGVHIP